MLKKFQRQISWQTSRFFISDVVNDFLQSVTLIYVNKMTNMHTSMLVCLYRHLELVTHGLTLSFCRNLNETLLLLDKQDFFKLLLKSQMVKTMFYVPV